MKMKQVVQLFYFETNISLEDHPTGYDPEQVNTSGGANLRLLDENTKILVNPTGRFVVGGP